MLGEYIASAPLTPLVKPGGGNRPIAVGIVWRRLVSEIRDSFNLSLQAWYLDDGTIVGDTLVVGERVAKTIVHIDAIAKINDPQCELLLLRSCTGDVLNYGFLASRLQSAGLQTKLFSIL
ncbi:hypothetical protein Tco_1421580, partial [Tanacetum coccineum]